MIRNIHSLVCLISLAAGTALAGTPTLGTEQSAFLTLINNFRVQNGAGTLQVSAALENSSQWMSSDMAALNYFSHTDSLGRSVSARVAAFGYPYAAGENIAAGASDAQGAFNLFYNACDPDAAGNCTYAHRKNMLGATYQVIGIGLAYNPSSLYGWFWTTDLGVGLDQTINPNPSPNPGNPTGTASFVRTDSATMGGWKAAYGAEGYNLMGDTASLPSSITVTPTGNQFWAWASSTSDPRGLQKSSGTDRIAASWYAGGSFSVDVNITDGKSHQMAVYSLDWENSGRGQTLDILDAGTNAVLDSRSLAGFTNGQYVVWNVTGHVILRLTRTAGNNTVISGIFFGGAPVVAGTSAQFLRLDTTTQGSWKGVYGAAGYNVLGDVAAYPSYALVTRAGESFWTWDGSSSDIRALQKSSAGNRVAATWYSGTNFTVDVNLTDGKSHQLAIYCVDWENAGRSQRIDVLDANTNLVLDSRSISAFANGEYVVWNITGHVTIRFTTGGSKNAVISGIFF